jgi:hypothetical protein
VVLEPEAPKGPTSTVTEYQRAQRLFTELLGDVPVVEIGKQHALQFRQALRQAANSDDVAQAFRNEAARPHDMISPAVPI